MLFLSSCSNDKQEKKKIFLLAVFSSFLPRDLWISPFVPQSRQEQQGSQTPPLAGLARINYPVSDGAHPSAAMWTVSGDNQKKHMVLSEDTLLPQPRPPSKMLMLVARQHNPDAKILNGRLMIRLLVGQRPGRRGVPLRTRVLSRNHYVPCDLFFYHISLRTPNQNMLTQ